MTAFGKHATTTIAAATAAIVIAQHVAASAARDAFFLANHPASALPGAVLMSAILSVAFLPFLARTMTRFGPAVVSPLAATISALLLVVEWALSRQRPDLAALAVFVHTTVIGSILVSGFWSLFNERFDPHTARQLMGRVAGGAALGGVVGGLLVERAGAAGIELPNLLPMVAVVQLLAAAGSRFLARGRSRTTRVARKEAAESYSSLLGSPYLRDIALLVVLTALVSTFTSFVLKAEAASTYLQSSELLRLFARYYLGVGLLGFVLQITLSRVSLNRFGLGMSIATLPASLGVLSLIAFATPMLWSLALLRGFDEALTNSLYRSGYELLYTPVAPRTKRRFKAVADIGFDRLGKALGSGLISLAISMFADTQVRVLLVGTVIGSVAAVSVAVRLSRGYVTSLTESLRSRAISLDANVLEDAITLRTMDGAGINRGELLAALSERAAAPETASIDFAGSDAGMWGTQTIAVRGLPQSLDATSANMAANTAADALLKDVAALRSGDRDRIRRVLRSNKRLDRHIVPYVISLLARDDVSALAVSALRRVVDTTSGQMVDALIDPGTSPVARRRLPQVLAGTGSSMAIDGLLQALDDSEFEVRFRSAGALMRSREAHPDCVIPHQAVFAAALRETRRCKQLLEQDASNTPDHRPLELLFRILSLALDPEPLKLAQHAVRSDDPQLRGTALEYLETILPANVLQELRPVIGARLAPPSARTRTAKELESELLASSAAMSIDVASLRRKLRTLEELLRSNRR
jgi:ATP:ADP antiporter, AAA family